MGIIKIYGNLDSRSTSNSNGGTIFNNISAVIEIYSTGGIYLWGNQGDDSTGMLNNGGACVYNYGYIYDNGGNKSCGGINNYNIPINQSGYYLSADAQFADYSDMGCLSITSKYNLCNFSS